MSGEGGKIIEFVKKHPYGTAIGVFGIGAVIVILLNRGGSAGTASTSGSSDLSSYYNAEAGVVQAGDQLQAAQLQANAQLAGQQATLTAQQTQAELQLSAVQAGYQSSDYQAGLAAAVAALNSNNQASTTDTANTLAANVATQNLATQLAIVQSNNNTGLGIATQNDLTQQNEVESANKLSASLASTFANANIQTAQIQANQANYAAGQAAYTAVSGDLSQTAQLALALKAPNASSFNIVSTPPLAAA